MLRTLMRQFLWAFIAVVVFTVRLQASGYLPGETVVRFTGNGGEEFDIELFGADAPLTVRNFLNYVESGRYDASIIHRTVPGFVIQGGGFALNGTRLQPVVTDASVKNEPGISNLRGTVAMAKLGGNPNSATSQWFINLADNSGDPNFLDSENGGYTVFGRVLGNGMSVADRIAGYQTFNATVQLGGAFGQLPLRTNALTRDNLILFESARVLAEGTTIVDFDFSESAQGFTGGFADLPANFDAAQYSLVADHRALPSGLGSGKALFLSGANRSDDLWMFWKKKLTGLMPNSPYEVVIDLEMASNVPAGVVGIGGAPGESVFVKAGASAVEPMAVEDSEGWLRWNIDKGNQSNGGKAASVLGNIAKEGDSTNNFVRLLRTNRSAKLSATSAADGSLWIFFGTDSGFEGTTSVYFTRATVVATPPVLFAVAGDFLGNFEGDPLRGQVALKIGKGGSFSGTILTPAGRVSFGEKFSSAGVASVPVSSPQGTLSLSLKTSGLGDGKWDVGDEVFIEAVLQTGGGEIPFELRPTARKGGPSTPLAGMRINTLLESLGKSGVEFGHGFAGVAVGRDGAVRLTGSLGDGTKLTGSARMVENGEGGWKLPVALPVAAVKGFLHGEVAVASSPGVGGFHLESSAPWNWIRPANAKAKSFAAGFQEELDVKGRVWSWTKGTSVLGGAGGNFTLAVSLGDNTGDFIPAPGLGNIQGRLGADNKPAWSAGPPPKGFSMRITPATGLFSGKIPGTQNGKPATVSYQGMLFPVDMPIGSGVAARGAGFMFGGESLGELRLTSEHMY